MAKPPTVADLTWLGDLKFLAVSDKTSITLDSAGVDGPSPVQSLGFALAGCMSMDVAYILTKGRHTFHSLRAHLVADRAPEEPHRIVKATIHFTVGGAVPHEAVARAIKLSHEKHCSVWHSMRQDIVFTTSYDVLP